MSYYCPGTVSLEIVLSDRLPCMIYIYQTTQLEQRSLTVFIPEEESNPCRAFFETELHVLSSGLE